MKQQQNLPDFPKLEEKVLAFWRERKIFKKSLDQTKNGKRFVFFEGPPTANGKPGIHHVEARAFKDIIPRYKTMQGFFVERKAGWDTHGLPVELEVEKSLGLKNKREIEVYGIAKFNDKCRESVWKYKDEWEKMTERIGFWLDLEHPYITYEPQYVESLWWVIKQIWGKGLLYQVHRVAAYCPRCGTVLSSHEMAQGYQDITEESVFVKFKIQNSKFKNVAGQNTYILAWTTTPWTVPGNLALAVGKDIAYVKTAPNDKGESYILAADRFEALKVRIGELGPAGERFTGKDLIGLKYQPLFEIAAFRENDKAYTVLPADFVSIKEGTGVVHTAVMYGEDDYQLGIKEGLPQHHTVDETGKFTEEVPLVAGQWFKDAEETIKKDLEQRGLLLTKEPYTHSYPHCWRCDTPLMYYARQSWYIRMSELREKLLAANEKINWVPKHIKDGRFGEWLREVKDWAFSRERYWGTPLPIWVCDRDKEHKECVGSFAELKKLALKPLPDDFDPHRPGVDAIELKCPQCGNTMHRIKELCDVWFDSGAMPFAQWHYPFENAQRVDTGESYPAGYISEAIDQTRGWFYTLLAVSVLLGRGVPYTNVICLGHVLDAKGQKMSKHLGNVIAPDDMIDRYGADAIRWFMYIVNQPGESKNFDEKVLADMVKKHFIILWNVLSFYKLFAKEEVEPRVGNHILDRWIAARAGYLISAVTESLDTFDITTAAREINSFVTDLSTWYVRRSRDRFKGDDTGDTNEALATLKLMLLTVARLAAPFTPFIAEYLYREVGGAKESVHLDAWPVAEEVNGVNQELIDGMKKVRKIVEVAHRLRAGAGIKVRQPLPQLVVSGVTLADELKAIIAAEVNVSEVHGAKALPTGAEWRATTEAGLAMALDTTITDELQELGYIREISRAVNALRKKAGLTPVATIVLKYHSERSELNNLFERYRETLLKETRASDLTAGSGTHATELKLGPWLITVSFD